MRKPRIAKRTVLRLSNLLDMRYRPAELAGEIGVSLSTIYKAFLPAGAPCERDAKRNIWIVGKAFRIWALEYQRAEREGRPRFELADGQAWCMKCNQPVTMLEPKKRGKAGGAVVYSGKCSNCGAKVNRFSRS